MIDLIARTVLDEPLAEPLAEPPCGFWPSSNVQLALGGRLSDQRRRRPLAAAALQTSWSIQSRWCAAVYGRNRRPRHRTSRASGCHRSSIGMSGGAEGPLRAGGGSGASARGGGSGRWRPVPRLGPCRIELARCAAVEVRCTGSTVDAGAVLCEGMSPAHCRLLHGLGDTDESAGLLVTAQAAVGS